VSEPSVVVTLDIGGSAAKAVAYDITRHAILASTSTPYPVAGRLGPGLFDPEAWWIAALGSLRSLVAALDVTCGHYLGVTVSAIRIPFVLVDGRGCPTAPGLLNKDRRAVRQVSEVTEAFGGGALYELTGHWPAPEFGLPKLLWVRATWPSAWSSAATVLQLHDWFVFKLSGAIVSEPSSAAMSQMLDLLGGTWAAELLDALDVPVDRFPELRRAGSVVGGLLTEVAHATGLRAGLPVHAGGGDTHLSALSTGFCREAVPVVVAGTTAPVQIALGSPRSPRRCYPLLLSEGAFAGQWVLESNAGPTGGVVAQLTLLTELSGDRLVAALVSLGFFVEQQIDEPLTVLTGNPCFGPVGWERTLAPTVVGLRGTHTGADVLAAALEGSCYAVLSMLAVLEHGYGQRPAFVVATGGMSTSADWCQLLADVTGHEIRVRPLSQVAGLAGAALVAGDEALVAVEQSEVLLYERRSIDPGGHLEGHNRYERLYKTLQLDHDAQLVGDAGAR
jgi:xylulokinase